jgi:hypothetical protein
MKIKEHKRTDSSKLFFKLQNRILTAADSSPENGNRVGESITGRTESQILFSDPDTHSHELCMQLFFYNAYKLKKYFTKCNIMSVDILVYNIKDGYFSSVEMLHLLQMLMYNLGLIFVMISLMALVLALCCIMFN